MSGAELLIVVVSFLACLLGPIAGIGGGVILKPVIDITGLMSIQTASFVSSCTVLSMALFTLLQMKWTRKLDLECGRVFSLALGSVCGGLVGKFLFTHLLVEAGQQAFVGVIQSAITAVLAALAAIYVVLLRKRHTSFALTSSVSICFAGACAGACWSFLGIGGGPFNFVLLVLLFGYSAHKAAQASLAIISCSQTAGLLYLFVTHAVPDFSGLLLVGTIASALLASTCGGKIAAYISDTWTIALYSTSLVVVIVLSALSIVKSVV